MCLLCGFRQQQQQKKKENKNSRVCVVGAILVSAAVFTHIGQLIIDAEALRGYSDTERVLLQALSTDEQSTLSRLQRIPLKLPRLSGKAYYS